MTRPWWLILTVLPAVLPLAAQEPAPIDPAAHFTEEVAVAYVLVPVVVRSGARYVKNLDKRDFRLLVDGKPVPIDSFEYRLEAPASVMVLQDLSGSMEGRSLELSREAVRFFLGYGLVFLMQNTLTILLASIANSRFRLTKGRAYEAGFKANAFSYMMLLRLVPLFPFFLINLAMGLTPMKTWTFYWVSQVGMLAGTLVYVNAGTQLARIESLSGIVSPGVLGSLVLLGIFPLIAKKVIDMFQARKVYARFEKPARFDRNILVIGGGSAGLVTAYIAAAIKAKVTLVEKHALGGDCLNTGCVPSKALIRSAKFLSHIQRASEFGMRSASADFDFGDVMERVQRVVMAIEPHDSVERYTGLGVDVAQGTARIVSPWAVEITHHDGRVETLTTRAIVIAAGARPFVPPIPGHDLPGCFVYRTIEDLERMRAWAAGKRTGAVVGAWCRISMSRCASSATLSTRTRRACRTSTSRRRTRRRQSADWAACRPSQPSGPRSCPSWSGPQCRSSSCRTRASRPDRRPPPPP